jgi:hypothetical protein
MYIGHLGVGLAATRARTGAPVVVLALATIAPDLGDIVFGLTGLDATGLYTHTVAAAAAWAVAVGLLGGWRYGATAGVVLGALCATHVPLDYITSRMEMWRGGPDVGLLLYAKPPVDFAVEAVVIFAGWWIYQRTLPRRGWAPIAMVALLIGLQGTFDALVAG